MAYKRTLVSVNAKRRRAEKHRDALDQKIGDPSRLKDVDRIVVSAKYDKSAGYYIVKTERLPSRLIYECATTIGDCIQNSRSALDHMMWQLASEFVNGGNLKDETGVQFPIESTRSGFEKHRVLPQIDPAYHTILESLQPYNGGKGDDLAQLRDLSNNDKHRFVTRLEVDLSEWDPFPFAISGFDFRFAVRPVQVGTEAFRMKGAPPFYNPQVDVEGYVAPLVLLENGEKPVVTLDRLRETVGAVIKALR